MSIVLGITGGIATGKSTVLRILGELGAETLSADDVAREVLARGEPAYLEVAAAFGSGVIDEDSGEIDRAALGELVFRDSEARRLLESITHPRIIDRLQRRIDDFRRSRPEPDAVLAVEIPLLIECGLEDMVDEVVVVTAEQEAQLSSLTTRNLSREESLRRIRSQMPIESKVARATRVVSNDSDVRSLESSVRRMWREICLPWHE